MPILCSAACVAQITANQKRLFFSSPLCDLTGKLHRWLFSDLQTTSDDCCTFLREQSFKRQPLCLSGPIQPLPVCHWSEHIWTRGKKKKKDNWRREQSGMPHWNCFLFIRAGMLCVISPHGYSQDLCKVSRFILHVLWIQGCLHIGDTGDIRWTNTYYWHK